MVVYEKLGAFWLTVGSCAVQGRPKVIVPGLYVSTGTEGFSYQALEILYRLFSAHCVILLCPNFEFLSEFFLELFCLSLDILRNIQELDNICNISILIEVFSQQPYYSNYSVFIFIFTFSGGQFCWFRIMSSFEIFLEP